MPRRRAPPAPLSPDLIKRDQQDFAVLGGIINLLEGFERAGLISDVPVAELAEWMKRRVSMYCAMRAEGLVDDDGPAPLTAKQTCHRRAPPKPPAAGPALIRGAARLIRSETLARLLGPDRPHNALAAIHAGEKNRFRLPWPTIEGDPHRNHRRRAASLAMFFAHRATLHSSTSPFQNLES